MNKLYLSSQSPRRQELLAQLGLTFKTINAPIEETALPKETPESFVLRMAIEKSLAGFNKIPGKKIWVIGSDTIVLIDDKCLGKPNNKVDAFRMLRLLSGRKHHVLTSVAVVNNGAVFSALNKTEVTFKEINDSDIESYWLTKEPQDKAGGYAIQGIGAKFIKEIKGSYSGVMGIALFELSGLLKESGYH